MTVYDLFFNNTTMQNVDLEVSPEEIRDCISKKQVVLVSNNKGPSLIINYGNINAVRVHQKNPARKKR